MSVELGYDIFRNDRNLNGGGTILLVNKSLNATPVVSLQNQSESVWVKILLDGESHYFASWYRPPSSNKDYILQLNDQLDTIRTSQLSQSLPNIHVLGDFNYSKIPWDKIYSDEGFSLSDTEGQNFIDILNQHGLVQLVNFPTRNDNILDLVITTTPGKYQDIKTADKFSDHDVVSACFSYRLPLTKQSKRKIYLYHKGDFDSMRHKTDLFAKDQYFNGHQNRRSVNENWSMIKRHILNVTETHIPSKTTKTRKQPPWISHRIRKLVRKRNRAHAYAKKHNSERLNKRWKQIRSQIKTETEKAHSDFINNMIGDIKNNPKPFWRYVNSKKQDKQNIPNLKRSDGSEATTDFDKAQCLNQQFSSVFTNTEYMSVPLVKPTCNTMTKITVTACGVENF